MTEHVVNSSIEEQLRLHGEVYTTTSGNSMKPLFRTHGSTVKLIAFCGEAARDDVILWRDASGKYLLHRVVKVTEDGYVTRGDNHHYNDPPITREQVVAIMGGYYRGEKFVPLTARRYRWYVAFWGRPNPIRAVTFWLRGIARRILRRKDL